MQRRREDIYSSTKSVIEIIDSARLISEDYDVDPAVLFDIVRTIFEIKSKIDGKTYIAKRL